MNQLSIKHHSLGLVSTVMKLYLEIQAPTFEELQLKAQRVKELLQQSPWTLACQLIFDDTFPHHWVHFKTGTA